MSYHLCFETARKSAENNTSQTGDWHRSLDASCSIALRLLRCPEGEWGSQLAPYVKALYHEAYATIGLVAIEGSDRFVVNQSFADHFFTSDEAEHVALTQVSLAAKKPSTAHIPVPMCLDGSACRK